MERLFTSTYFGGQRMKKILIAVLTLGLVFTLASDNLFAGGIGIKGGYSFMQNDFDDPFKFKDTYNFGVYFDMGTFLFSSLRFRPGVDYVTLEQDLDNGTGTLDADLWGIHFDWYWHFLGNASISPFIGFGPTLNYYDWDRTENDDDSDAGVDLFAGLTFGISGTPFELMLEARYKFVDIAETDQNILQANIGILYKF